MSKPDDIPQDVWGKVLPIARQYVDTPLYDGDEVPIAVTIARAILAEREACVTRATAQMCGACRAYGDFAAAIRKGGE